MVKEREENHKGTKIRKIFVPLWFLSDIMDGMLRNRYNIRLAKLEEITHLQEIELAAGKIFHGTEYSYIADFDPTSYDLLYKQQKEDLLWVICDSRDKAVGFILILIIDGMVHIHEVSVDPSHARQGLGRRLIETVCEWGKEKGYRAVTLSTFGDIEWNGPYYGRLGFKELKEEELNPGLKGIRKKEEEAGLPIDKRICMRLEI